MQGRHPLRPALEEEVKEPRSHLRIGREVSLGLGAHKRRLATLSVKPNAPRTGRDKMSLPLTPPGPGRNQ